MIAINGNASEIYGNERQSKTLGTDAEKPEALDNSEICKRYRNTEKGKKVHLKSSRKWYRINNGAAMRNIQRKNEKLRRAFETGGLKAIDPLLAAIMG